jgi:hypothetical protein
VSVSKPAWKQQLDFLPHQLRSVVSEQPFSLGVDQHDATFSINDDHRIGRRLTEDLVQ